MRAALLALSLAGGLLGPLAVAVPTRAAGDFDSAYMFESSYLANLQSGDTGAFVVFFMNTGALNWTNGTETQVNLGACLDDKVTCNVAPKQLAWNPGTWLSSTAYAAQTKADVAPADFTSFTYQVKVPVNTAAGTYHFNGDLVVAATGALVHPEGYYQDASVIASAQQAPTDLAVLVTDANASGGPNDVRATFSVARLNTVSSYDVQRRDGQCP